MVFYIIHSYIFPGDNSGKEGNETNQNMPRPKKRRHANVCNVNIYNEGLREEDVYKINICIDCFRPL